MGTQWCLGVVVPSRGASPKMSNSLNGLKQTGKLRSVVCGHLHWLGFVFHWEAAPLGQLKKHLLQVCLGAPSSVWVLKSCV